MKRLKSVVLGTLAVAAVSASADTLVWWRFDEVASGGIFGTKTLVNSANPGTCDGRGYCVKGTDWSESVTGAYAPHGATAFPDGVKLYDPVSGLSHDNGRAMNLNGYANGSVSTSGAVKGNDTTVFHRQTFTAEAFIRMTAAKATTISGNSTYWKTPHPIFSITSGVGAEEWCLFYYHNSLGTRMRLDNYNVRVNGRALNDERWHHVAIVADGSSGTSVKVKLYLDYEKWYELDCEGQFSYEDMADFNIGVNPFASTRKWPGEIDEFRFSDTALAPDKFLRFVDPQYDPSKTGAATYETWHDLDPNPTDYWFGSASFFRRDRVYYAPDSYWKRVNHAFGGSEGLGKGNYLDERAQSNVWTKLYGEPVADNGSFRTIDLEEVTLTDQQQGGYFILTPPADATPLTDGDFTIEYWCKSNGGSKLGTGVNATVLMYPTDANGGEYKTPDPVIQQFFSAGGTGWVKFKNAKSGTAVDDQYTLPCTLDSKWHRLAFVYEKAAGRLTAYVDRVKAWTQEDVELPSTSQGMVFGSRGRMWNNNYAFDGWIDEVRITRKALSRDELMQRVYQLPGMVMMVR